MGVYPMLYLKLDAFPFSNWFFMMMNNLLVWNCREAGGRNFPSHVKDLVRIHNLNFVAILEPRISGNKADIVISRIGFDGGVRVEARGFARGTWCMWRQNQVSIQVPSSSDQCILLQVNPRSNRTWLLAVIYVSPQARGREALWDELRMISQNYNLPWCALGDFNTVLYDHEKVGGGSVICSSCQTFNHCIDVCQLVDLGYNGPTFTWKKGDLRERLDRALANTRWQDLFPTSSVTNIPISGSEHCGIWLRTDSNSSFRHRPYFKFLGPWLDHQDFHSEVTNSWRIHDSWDENINRLTVNLSRWNKLIYGNIVSKKRRLIGRMEGIDRKLMEGHNERLVQLKKDLWTEYNTILKHKEAYWFQQSRIKWLKLGDKNTRYFHQSTLIIRRSNKIDALKDEQEIWVFEDEDIRKIFV